MPRGNPARKLAITMDADVYAEVAAAAAEDGTSISAWVTDAAYRAVLRRNGFRAVAEYQAEFGAFTDAELAKAEAYANEILGIASPATVE